MEGEGVLHVDKEIVNVKPGRAVYVPPGAVQYLENTGDGELSFLCIVDPMWTAEQDRGQTQEGRMRHKHGAA
ncbi:hypothetical protein SSCH_1720002 [Syntrophaceticus schinkii]|uniref:Cupin type-2 domain-containing protein n=1 Tax=Syntrophaceticus schinkii TaxID=499207 RepID=A0A0B7MCR0_9FIRM|nr:hypothetical protein SSCH_1720002 [Syntrophaceticus schinkii]